MGNEMTKAEARLKISIHAGKTEYFSEGYRYLLKYGVQDLSVLQQKFDEIFMCLKVLKEASGIEGMDKELFLELNEMLWGGILYINSQANHYRAVGVFSEVLSETINYLLQGIKDPFEAFDNYKDNYDIILSEAEKQ